jgi:pSer/pThr/pTyr-binding forkhead associated (FHA) protein
LRQTRSSRRRGRRSTTCRSREPRSSGGGRQGETFPLEAEHVEIGRSPDADVFLDDVTVSRSHAGITRDADGYTIEDRGSLNGTYVNRRRVEKAKLEDGDEVQIGKYRLTFLARA